MKKNNNNSEKKERADQKIILGKGRAPITPTSTFFALMTSNSATALQN